MRDGMFLRRVAGFDLDDFGFTYQVLPPLFTANDASLMRPDRSSRLYVAVVVPEIGACPPPGTITYRAPAVSRLVTVTPRSGYCSGWSSR